MEEQPSASGEAPTPAPKRKALWIAIAVIVVVVVVLLAAVLLGVLGGGAKPQAIFFAGYPGAGDTIIPTWWNNRASWPAEWLYSEGLRSPDFFWRLAAKGVDVATIEGTAPTAPIDANSTAAYNLFDTAYRGAFGSPPNLFDSNSYDALFLLALAFQKSGTLNTNSSSFKQALRDVSSPPGTAIRPGEWSKALTELGAGRDIDFQGAAGADNFDQYGEVGSDYEVWHLDATVNITQKLFIPEGSWVSSSAASVHASGLPGPVVAPTQTDLKIGTLFDRTGALKDFGPHMENATNLARDQINAAGGITISGTNYNILLIHEDDGTNPTTARDSASKLVNTDHVSAIIGATASSSSLAALAVTAPAGIILISASSTSPKLTTADTTDQFWRTAASDALQGRAASWYAFVKRGWRTMSIAYVDNAYGLGIGNVFRTDFEARGGTILRMVPFSESVASVNANSVLTTLFTPGKQSSFPAIATWRED